MPKIRGKGDDHESPQREPEGNHPRMSYDNLSFEVTDVPPVRLRGSKSSSANPFRQPLEDSFKSDFAETNEWFQFTVSVDEVDKAINSIRAAGQIEPKIGTEVRPDRETGRVAFRGVPWEPRVRPTSDGESGKHAAEEQQLSEY